MDINEHFELLKNIIYYSETPDLNIDLSAIEEIIFKNLPNSVNKDDPSELPELYFDFKNEYEHFKEFILYEQLIGKNIVALGGEFSSGKSSFLNSIMGNEILPIAIAPASSVPTYLIHGENDEAYGMSTLHSRVEMNVGDVMYLSYGVQRANGEIVYSPGQLLSSLFIQTPYQKFDSIAILDTPGYINSDSEDYSPKTDEKLLRTQLNASNYILWFFTTDSETLPENELNLLKSLKPDIPILIVINKADQIASPELDGLVAKIKSTLDDNNIKYLDVLTFSSNTPEAYDKEKILQYFDDWNGGVSRSRFANNFKTLFTRYSEYLDEKIDEENKEHSRLSNILADISAENDDAREYLNSLDNKVKNRIFNILEMKNELADTQNVFFNEIKRIADEVNIYMPEASQIEIFDGKVLNPIEMIEMYCEKYDLNDDERQDNLNEVRDVIDLVFADVVPCINDVCGGTEYHKQFRNEIESILKLSVDSIHMHDCMKLNGDIISNVFGG